MNYTSPNATHNPQQKLIAQSHAKPHKTLCSNYAEPCIQLDYNHGRTLVDFGWMNNLCKRCRCIDLKAHQTDPASTCQARPQHGWFVNNMPQPCQASHAESPPTPNQNYATPPKDYPNYQSEKASINTTPNSRQNKLSDAERWKYNALQGIPTTDQKVSQHCPELSKTTQKRFTTLTKH